jgi:membrane fusion protein (multidrug efflux system)
MAMPGSVSKSRWIAGAALVVLVIAAGAGWLFFGHSAKAPQVATAQPPAPAVGVRVATMKGVSQSFEFVGRVKAIEKVELRARVEGFLEKVLFREGQDVKAGELLYQIEKVQFQAALDQAKANLAVAEAALTNAKVE